MQFSIDEKALIGGACLAGLNQDGIHLPFENVLDYESFTVRIAEDDIPNLTTILRVCIQVLSCVASQISLRLYMISDSHIKVVLITYIISPDGSLLLLVLMGL